MDLYKLFDGQIKREHIRRDEPMRAHTTFRTGGPADWFLTPDEDELIAAVKLCRAEELPMTIIGNGSNLLVSDEGIRGIVIEIGKEMAGVEICGSRVYAQAGALLSAVSLRACDHGLSGMEFATGIPGSIGGGVVMNAGAYGGEICDVLVRADVLTKDGRRLTLMKDELELSYRHSIVTERGYIVLNAEFELQPGEPEQIRERVSELREKRVSKQPVEYPSAGSTFKRPEGYYAGKLIEDAGLRGYRIGGAQVSEKHCGFVINAGHASSAEVYRLIRTIQQEVYRQNRVLLEPEVRIIGAFAQEDGIKEAD